jgi:uncharacterized repeat protein (TIGR01451 family)
MGHIRNKKAIFQPLSALLLLVSTHTWALSGGDVSISLISGAKFISDSNNCLADGPRRAHVGYTITNTSGHTLNDVQATLNISSLNSTFAFAGSPQPQNPTISLGTLANDEKLTAFWYVSYPCHPQPNSSVTFTVTVADEMPGTVTSAGNTITSYSSISAGTGGQVNGFSIAGSAVVGQVLNLDVDYEFGNVGAGNEFFMQPVGNFDFNAGCFQLVGSEVTASDLGALTVGTKDKLYFTAGGNQGGSGHVVTVRYRFNIRCANTSTISNPYAAQTSGSTNLKYTSNFGDPGASVTFPVASFPFTISKSVTPDNIDPESGGTVTYTVVINNTSSTTATVDRITDAMPSSVSYEGLGGGSGITASNSASLPLAGETDVLEWLSNPPTATASYTIAGNSSLSLVYDVDVPPALATDLYANTVYATAGDTDTNTAQAVFRVGNPPVISFTKTASLHSDADGSSGISQGDTLRYTLTVANQTGADAALNMNVIDVVPEELTYSAGSISGGDGRNAGAPATTGLSWSINSLTAGASVQLSFDATVKTGVLGAVSNQASLNGANFSATLLSDDPAVSGGSNPTIVTVVPGTGPALSFSKTAVLASDLDISGDITSGDTLRYNLVLSNAAGAGTGLNLSVADILPAGLTYVAASMTGGDSHDDSAPGSTGLGWTINSLVAGASTTLTFNATVDAGACATINNQALVTGNFSGSLVSDDPASGGSSDSTAISVTGGGSCESGSSSSSSSTTTSSTSSSGGDSSTSSTSSSGGDSSTSSSGGDSSTSSTSSSGGDSSTSSSGGDSSTSSTSSSGGDSSTSSSGGSSSTSSGGSSSSTDNTGSGGNNGDGEGLTTAVRGAGSFDIFTLLMAALLLLSRYRIRLRRVAPVFFFGLTLCALQPSAAQAQNVCGESNSTESDGYEFEPCWYLGIGAGSTKVHPEGEAAGWHTVDDSSEGKKLFLGYLLRPHWFAELAYTDAGAAKLGNRDPLVSGNPGLSYEIPSVFIGYLLNEPDSKWNLYAKAGTSAISNEVNDSRVPFDKKTSVQLALGAGVQWRFTERWFLRLEHDSFDRDSNYTGLSIGTYLGAAEREVAPQPQPQAVATAETVDCTAFTGTMAGVQFHSNSAQLTASAEQVLAEAAGNLKSFTGLRLEIQAHTDNQGNDAYNMALSEKRAQSVMSFLVSQGIAAERLTARGYGETRQAESNDTVEGRAANRRVEFVILDDSGCDAPR